MGQENKKTPTLPLADKSNRQFTNQSQQARIEAKKKLQQEIQLKVKARQEAEQKRQRELVKQQQALERQQQKYAAEAAFKKSEEEKKQAEALKRAQLEKEVQRQAALEVKRKQMREETKKRIAENEEEKHAELIANLGIEATQSSVQDIATQSLTSSQVNEISGDNEELTEQEDVLENIEFCSTNVGININEFRQTENDHTSLSFNAQEANPSHQATDTDIQLNRHSDCSFCKTSMKKSSLIIYEDNYFTVYLHRSPINLGHLLIFPKNHVTHFKDIHPYVVNKMFSMASKLSHILQKIFPKSQGISLFLNDPLKEDPLHHAHLNLFPRTSGDGLKWRLGTKQGHAVNVDTLKKVILAIKRHYRDSE